MDWAVFIGLTVLLFGFAAAMTGHALAANWRPLWQLFLYTALLGLANRFLVYALFAGELLSWRGYLIDTAALCGIALIVFRLTRVSKMVFQYPWLYERAGPFFWRTRRSVGG